ncbi:DUF2492 family protein [Photobacterium damselae subsp. piscicida]|uniref:YecH family protein n=1 Tax=Photobacterium damsela subsp. piscicida TaxID=38294 RepID=A0A1Q9H1X4_PHODP|nr:YecH family metal-binding protein [Photobacterium damselae]MDP2516463.1 YecH family protein [Photobacterium damselae subsp. piscicida]MDP2533493.1 YecH family protein [Photobacterium damselae subsp. piscicida]MDP2544028.1 YecH family protein [Photobacterium damselae subsp. piscicida]MDP2557247.1 YecH family protein [Photobacterium damselae subsp. piscicida]MDP2568588.1 YecH family protein [Photobacterium damselae subsp. piscicida]
MTESIHGHEVLHKLLDENKHYTPASLMAEIEAEYGADVRFHTCSQQDLTLQQLLDFLLAKGKIMLVDEELTANPARMCHH